MLSPRRREIPTLVSILHNRRLSYNSERAWSPRRAGPFEDLRVNRSEERRVGEKGRARWGPDHLKKKKDYEGVGVVRRTTNDCYKRIRPLRDRFRIVTADLLDQPTLGTAALYAKPDAIYTLETDRSA